MSTLVVGDLHLKQRLVLPRIDELIADRPAIDRIVFLGDACDDWGATESYALDALGFYAAWAEKRRADGLRIDVLLGNHDFCYIRGKNGPGSLMGIRRELRTILEERLQAHIATTVGPYLCTHAGLTDAWARKHLAAVEPDAEALAAQLNGMLTDSTRWPDLDSCPPSRGGWSLPGPLWADLFDLQADFLDGLAQAVGHTPIATATRFVAPWEREDTATPIWACDTMSLTAGGTPIGDGSMVLVENDGTACRIPFGEKDHAFAALMSASFRI